MLKNHRNRACVRRFESKFIYLTCGPSASFFGNFVWRPPRKKTKKKNTKKKKAKEEASETKARRKETIIGSVAAAISFFFACEQSTSVKSFEYFTINQIDQVSAFILALRSIISMPAMLNPKSSRRSLARDRSNGFKPSKVARASRVAPSCWKCSRTIKLVIVQHSSTFSFRSSQYLR